MEITIEAMKLFIQSLPVGCQFAINLFGTRNKFIPAAKGDIW